MRSKRFGILMAVILCLGVLPGRAINAIAEEPPEIEPYEEPETEADLFHVILPDTIEGGTVTVEPEKGVPGTEVVLTAIPDENYTADQVTVTAGENSVTLTEIGENQWTFVLPESDVTVSATFTKLEEESEQPLLQNTPMLRGTPVLGNPSTHTHNAFTAWTDTLAMEQNGSGKTAANSLPANPGSYYLTQDVTLSSLWELRNKTISLCLNGHAIRASGEHIMIRVYDGATLNLYDCGTDTHYYTINSTTKLAEITNTGKSFTGGYITGAVTPDNDSYQNRGAGIQIGKPDASESGGTVNMYGGTIIGNKAYNTYSRASGGGVSIDKGAFNMYGGAIIGNTSLGEGTGVDVIGTDAHFNMYGGTITDNTNLYESGSYTAGGVYVGSGTMSIQGLVTITGNTITNGKAGNVFLISSKTLNVTGSLDSNSRIGVALTYNQGSHGTGIVTSGLSGKGNVSNFTADEAGVSVRLSGTNEAELYVPTGHVHHFSYSASENKITATCDVSECPLSDHKVELTLNAAGGIYNRTAYTAALENLAAFNSATDLNVSYNDIKYFNGSTSLTSAPVNVGSYTAKVTVQNVTAQKGFEITKKEAALSWSNLQFTYDGKAHVPSASVSNLIIGDSCTVTVGGEQVNAGTHTATASFLSNSNYSLPSEKTTSFTILKANRSAPSGISTSPASTSESEDGKILNASSEMEFRKEDVSSYTSISNTEVNGQKAGTYYVRYKETVNYNASADAAAIISTVGKRYRAVGDGLTWTKGSSDSLILKFEANIKDEETFNRFRKLTEGNVEIGVDHYSKEPGSIIITFKPTYLESLAEGKHTLTAVFNDGQGEGVFYIAEKGASKQSSTPTKKTNNVVTCQMAGYPANYVWNEAAKACQAGYYDAGGNFHPYNAVRRSAPNTGDSANTLVFAWIFMLATALACFCGVRLLHEDWEV